MQKYNYRPSTNYNRSSKHKPDKPKQSKPLIQPEWNSCVQDQDQYKLSKAD